MAFFLLTKEVSRALRQLWQGLILRVWGEDPLICPCCKGAMKVVWWTGDEEVWQAPELPLGDGRVLVLDADKPVHATP